MHHSFAVLGIAALICVCFEQDNTGPWNPGLLTGTSVVHSHSSGQLPCPPYARRVKSGTIHMHGNVRLEGSTLYFGNGCGIRFMRTLRIPDDGRTYPLPPGLGEFPIYPVDDYAGRVPVSWQRNGGYFIPMYQAEAMWISFNAERWEPKAVKVGVGGINALDGEQWNLSLSASPQNYLVVPRQPWLDGIKSGEGTIRQFVAMPLGKGYTVEAQLTGRETEGGIQIAVFESRPGAIHEPRYDMQCMRTTSSVKSADAEMGLGAGGEMTQKVYEDTYGIEAWDTARYAFTVIHIVNSETFKSITGQDPPPTPVTAASYTEHGYPWFALYDEHMKDIDPTMKLKNVQSVGTLDKKKGLDNVPNDSSITVPDSQVVKLKPGMHKGKHHRHKM
jgi:hypothetical protein